MEKEEGRCWVTLGQQKQIKQKGKKKQIKLSFQFEVDSQIRKLVTGYGVLKEEPTHCYDDG